MISKTMNVPDAFFARYKTALSAVYAIPVDEETEEPLYTNAEWVLEDVKKMMKQRLATLESKAASKAASASITPNSEDVSFT